MQFTKIINIYRKVLEGVIVEAIVKNDSAHKLDIMLVKIESGLIEYWLKNKEWYKFGRIIQLKWM